MTAAPVGQPSIIITTNIFNVLVGLAFQSIPSNDIRDFSEFAATDPGERSGMVLPYIWKQALSVAVGVSGMSYLGCLHPPAASLSYAFATNPKWKITNLPLIFLGDVIMIVMSVVMLNLFEKKQYPLFWFGFKADLACKKGCGKLPCGQRGIQQSEPFDASLQMSGTSNL